MLGSFALKSIQKSTYKYMHRKQYLDAHFHVCINIQESAPLLRHPYKYSITLKTFMS